LAWGARSVPYYINSLGYRDRSPREVPASAEGRRRILLIGDSFVEGLGVVYAETVGSQLEEVVKGRGGAIEVLNGAVASYSPFLYYRTLRRFFERGYSATDVVVFLDISDVQDEATAGYERLGENDNFRSESWQSVLDLLRQSEVVQQYWETMIFASLTQRDDYYRVRDRWTEDDELYNQYGKVGVERCQQLLLRIRSLVESHQARMLLVIYPWKTQLASQRLPSRAEIVFAEFAARNGIALVNAFPAFRNLPNWSSHFLPDDPHWNAEGHRLMAMLVANRLLPPAPQGPGKP
jgi:lysophospholipase L1-like esterase